MKAAFDGCILKVYISIIKGWFIQLGAMEWTFWKLGSNKPGIHHLQIQLRTVQIGVQTNLWPRDVLSLPRNLILSRSYTEICLFDDAPYKCFRSKDNRIKSLQDFVQIANTNQFVTPWTSCFFQNHVGLWRHVASGRRQSALRMSKMHKLLLTTTVIFWVI